MKVVLASNNKGKLRELGELLAGQEIQVVPQSEFDIPDAIEDGLSFVENAIIKARHASALSGLPAIADDSGLEVDALRGEPGIHSARYAGEDAKDTDNNSKLLAALSDTPEAGRSARFQCVMVYMRHPNDPTPLVCQGTWEGRILEAARGDNGFGYDPLFWLPGEQASAAELPAESKNARSHRGQALRCLLQKLATHAG